MSVEEWNVNDEEDKGDEEVMYEENCVYALSLILWEILTDSVPFSDNTPNEVSQIVNEKGMPNIEKLNAIDERLYHIISASLMKKGRRERMGLDELESLLRGEYGMEEVMDVERETENELPPDTAKIVMEDDSEIVEE